MVLRRCRGLLKKEDWALDAMQEVFMLLLKKQETLTMKYPSSLLYTMATNVCLGMIRAEKNKREDTVAAGSGSDGEKEDILEQIAELDENFERFELGDILARIFNKEKPSTRIIAVLHFVDGLTLAETARETGLSVSGIRKRIRQLQEKISDLREKFGEVLNG